MERTYSKLAFTKHPYYGDLSRAVRQQGMPLSVDDITFATTCNLLAWNMMEHPMSDADYDTAKSLLVVGTEVGGVSWSSADSIAVAFALTRDYEEASKWLFVSTELYRNLNNPPVDGATSLATR